MKVRVFLVFAIVMLFCYGCAPAIRNIPVNTDKSVTYIVPKNGIKNTDRLAGVSIVSKEYNYYQGNLDYHTGYKVIYKDNTLSIAYLDTYGSNSNDFSKTLGSALEYIFNYEIKDNDNNNKHIIIKPVVAIEYKDKDPVMGKPVPNYTIDDAINALKNVEIVQDVEIDSSYNSDSIYANFKRLLKEKRYTKPVTIVGNIYNSSYNMVIDDTISDCYVNIYPYRNGSKAVVHIKTTIQSKNNIIDLPTKIELIKTKLASVVNN